MAADIMNIISTIRQVAIAGVATLVLAVGPAAAQGITVTSGFLEMQPSSGPLLLGGDRGLTLDSTVAAADGVFGPSGCNSSPWACVPGATIDLTALWTSSDVRGTATLDGRLYPALGSAQGSNHVSVHFTGSAVLPAFSGAPVTITAPFAFSGSFDHADASATPAHETLSGQGAAIVSLVPSAVVQGAWSLAGVRYLFQSQAPQGWVDADIGTVGLAGSAAASGSRTAVTGAGADIWGGSDSFHFVFQPASTTSAIVTRVESAVAANPYAKAGIMLRGDAGPSAPHVVLAVKPNGELEFMRRAANGGATDYLRGAGPGFPVWLKLERQNDVVNASYSSDGQQWTVLGTTQVQGLRFAGLIVTSHDTGSTSNAVFRDTTVGSGAGIAASPWAHADVGAVGTAGVLIQDSSMLTVRGAGADIWGSADAFHFVYDTLAGDGGVTVRVGSLQNTNTFAKAGVMIRNSLAPGAAHVILDVRPSGEIEFMTRTADGGSTSYRAGSATAFPGWLKLLRRGNTFTGYVSADGTNWTTVGSIAAALSADALRGIVVSSHDTGRLTEASFSGLTLLP